MNFFAIFLILNIQNSIFASNVKDCLINEIKQVDHQQNISISSSISTIADKNKFISNNSPDKIKEMDKLLKELNKEMRNSTESRINHSEDFIKRNNQLMIKYAQMLRNDGIQVQVTPSKYHSDYLHLKIVSINKDAPSVMKYYLRVKEKLKGGDMTISLIDNQLTGSDAFFRSSDKRVELGIRSLSNIFENKKVLEVPHEMRHLMWHNRRLENKNLSSIFNIKLKTNGKYSIAGKKLMDDYQYYPTYMSLEELYTYASELWQISKGGLRSYNSKKMKSILREAGLLEIISKRTLQFSKTFKDQIKNKQVTLNYNGSILIATDKLGRQMSLSVDKEIIELIKHFKKTHTKKSFFGLINKPAEANLADPHFKMIRSLLENNLLKMEHFASKQNLQTKLILTQVRKIETLNFRQKEILPSDYQKLNKLLVSIGQNSRFMYQK